MTTAILYRAPSGKLIGFAVIGHAGYADAGEDIVCAGVSALTQTAANALERVAGVLPKVRAQPGMLLVRLPKRLREGSRHDAQVILRTMAQGLTDMQQAYPEYIRVIWKDRRCSTCSK